ncbi:EscU/YscU/HrcU family type III secretion system export apparatus switch protein [Aurantivibrio plasticivorans]
MSNNQINLDEIEKAIALYYDGESAPILTAKGTGSVAEQIVNIAKESGVPLCDNEGLADLLIQLDIGDEIPEALYLSIAYIISFAYQLQGKEPKR